MSTLQNPIAFHPYYNSDRICEQKGLFTIHSGHVWPGLPEPQSLKTLNAAQKGAKIYEEVVCTVDNPQEVMRELAIHFGASKGTNAPSQYLQKKFKLDQSTHQPNLNQWHFTPTPCNRVDEK